MGPLWPSDNNDDDDDDIDDKDDDVPVLSQFVCETLRTPQNVLARTVSLPVDPV